MQVSSGGNSELNLKDRDAVSAFEKPKHVILDAAKGGGILANATYPVEFLSENMRIHVNMLDANLAAMSVRH
jgi:GDP-L-fucose synthase